MLLYHFKFTSSGKVDEGNVFLLPFNLISEITDKTHHS